MKLASCVFFAGRIPNRSEFAKFVAKVGGCQEMQNVGRVFRDEIQNARTSSLRVFWED